MHNIALIYEHVHEIKMNTRKPLIINIPQEIFDGNSLVFLVQRIKYLLRYKYMNYNLVIHLKTSEFADKITYLVLEAIIFDLLNRSSFTINIIIDKLVKEATTHSRGFLDTALCRALEKSRVNKKVFLDLYKKPIFINSNTYRRFLSKEILKSDSEIPSIIYTELASILSVYSDDEEWNDSIAETISELVCNIRSHTEDDCLIDISFGQYKHMETNEPRLIINIAVLNFSENRLFDKIKRNIEMKKYAESDELYNKIYRAQNVHDKFFNQNYTKEHLFIITAFQNRVSSRNFESGNNGTGLTNLIQSMIGKSEQDYSYVLTGKHMLFFKDEYLKISGDKFVGFNKENDYFNHRPADDAISQSSLYFPGTVYQLIIVKEPENE